MERSAKKVLEDKLKDVYDVETQPPSELQGDPVRMMLPGCSTWTHEMFKKKVAPHSCDVTIGGITYYCNSYHIPHDNIVSHMRRTISILNLNLHLHLQFLTSCQAFYPCV